MQWRAFEIFDELLKLWVVEVGKIEIVLIVIGEEGHIENMAQGLDACIRQVELIGTD